jgi:hypothetical protein
MNENNSFLTLFLAPVAAYAQMIQPTVALLNQRMAKDGMLSGFDVRKYQKNLTLSFDIGINTAWKHIMQISSPRSGNFGIEERRSMKSKKGISK